MNTIVHVLRLAFIAAALSASPLTAQFRAVSTSARPAESPVTLHARGTFEVQVVPVPVDAYTDATTLGRMTIDKQFSGDLVGIGKGQMITGMGTAKGSAAYSAIERVTGTMHGRQGSFLMQHTGIMTRGEQSLVITIIPDSGTDGLTGISGAFHLTIEGKVHKYDIEYTLPDTH
jgi:hypothetical protein